jgi:hypothetical protein
MGKAKQNKHDELCQVYKEINEEGRERLIQVADQLRKAQTSIGKHKSALREETEKTENGL